jgi:hypothetical protein
MTSMRCGSFGWCDCAVVCFVHLSCVLTCFLDTRTFTIPHCICFHSVVRRIDSCGGKIIKDVSKGQLDGTWARDKRQYIPSLA